MSNFKIITSKNGAKTYFKIFGFAFKNIHWSASIKRNGQSNSILNDIKITFLIRNNHF